MRKEVFSTLKKELQYAAILFLSAVVIFKIAFLKENLAVLLRNVLSLFWLFVLPGYFIMLYWKESLDFMERFIIGIALSAGITGMSSYYLGLIGLDIKYHTVLLPLTIIIAGFVMAVKKE